MEDIKRLNKKLDETYGRSVDGRPIFRIVWSDSQTEKRVGTFREYIGPIFLREETKLAERKKYPDIKSRWILEKLIFPPAPYCYELDLINGSYEPIWTFEGKGGIFVKPEWWACEQLCKFAIYGPERRLTASELEDIDQKAFEKEVQHNLDVLEDHDPLIPNLIRAGEGIVVPSTFEKGT